MVWKRGNSVIEIHWRKENWYNLVDKWRLALCSTALPDASSVNLGQVHQNKQKICGNCITLCGEKMKSRPNVCYWHTCVWPCQRPCVSNIGKIGRSSFGQVQRKDKIFRSLRLATFLPPYSFCVKNCVSVQELYLYISVRAHDCHNHWFYVCMFIISTWPRTQEPQFQCNIEVRTTF